LRRMKEVSPSDLPNHLYHELIDEEGNWKHHSKILSDKLLDELEQSLKEAGIEIKKGHFTREEDRIIMNNFEKLKDELGYQEGEDPRMYAGFGLKEEPDVVADFIERANQYQFNPRIGEKLLDRHLRPIRNRFIRLFDPKKLALQQQGHESSFQLREAGDRKNTFVVSEGKRCRMNERELEQVLDALKEHGADEETVGKNGKKSLRYIRVARTLHESMGDQWCSTAIENSCRALASLDGHRLPTVKWPFFYTTLLSHVMKEEKRKSELELVGLFENEQFDWENRVPWLEIAVCRGVRHKKKALIKAWRRILPKLRELLEQYKENGRPFVIYRMVECILEVMKFDDFIKTISDEKEEEDERRKHEWAMIELEKSFVDKQRKTNKNHNYAHAIVRFEEGKLIEIHTVPRLTNCTRQKTKKPAKRLSKERRSKRESMEEEPPIIDTEDDEFDGPLEGPLWLLDSSVIEYDFGVLPGSEENGNQEPINGEGEEGGSEDVPDETPRKDKKERHKEQKSMNEEAEEGEEVDETPNGGKTQEEELEENADEIDESSGKTDKKKKKKKRRRSTVIEEETTEGAEGPAELVTPKKKRRKVEEAEGENGKLAEDGDRVSE
ncbi:hypothetical protein PMAYCL1PPCAC_14281, partial [Pristionchus mayeri]